MRTCKTVIRAAAVAALLLSYPGASVAQSAAAYPTKPIRFVVPWAPGAGLDILARTIAPKMTEALGQQVIVDNRPGASSIIGTEMVARATPDGYTLIMASNNHAINSALFAKVPFDPVKDFAAVGGVANYPMVLVVNTSLPAKNVPDVIALTRAKPGQLSYATTGNGTPPHVAAELFKQLSKTDVVHVPYKGSAEALTGVISGQVHLMFVNPLSSLQHVRAGRLRALAVTTLQRISIAPELPTVAESGLPGFNVSLWSGILVPRATPPDIIAKLNRELVRVLASPDMKEKLIAQGSEVTPSTPDEFAKLIVSEMDRLGKIAKAANMRVD